MSTCMIVIVCVVHDSKIMAKLMKNARNEFADTANTGSKNERHPISKKKNGGDDRSGSHNQGDG